MSTPYCPSCDGLTTDREGSCPECGAERPVEGWPEDDFVGRLFLDSYNVIKRLGSGGFGVVYLAENREFRAQRAIKVLDPRHVHNDNILRRFKREAKALYQLQSPYTVRVERWGRTPDGHYYLVMELAEGETLRQLLERKGTVDERRALSLIRQTAVALSDAHALGILHRDLKPDNLVLRRHPHEGEQVAVLDFGISKILADQSTNRRSGLVGTPAYMAPESWKPALGKVNIRADLWSLGVIAYEMLVGKLPYQDTSDEDMMTTAMRVAHLELDDVLLALEERSVHSRTRDIVLKLLEPRPDDRYQTPAEVVAAVDSHPLWATTGRKVSHPDTPIGLAAKAQTAVTMPDPMASRRAEAGDRALADTVDSLDLKTPESGEFTFFEDEPPEYLRLSRNTLDGDNEPERRGPSLWIVILAVAVLGGIAFGTQFAGDLLGGTSTPDAGTSIDSSADAGGPATLPLALGPLSDGMTVHLVEGGPFVMGEDAAATPTPAHDVILEPFYVDAHEVTVGMWRGCVDRGPCHEEHVATATDRDGCRQIDSSRSDDVLPLNCVSWEGAKAYCQTFDRRLPSEAEWERAAQVYGAGPAAAAEGNGAAVANGDYPADLLEGLGEWVSDWFSSDYYDVSPTIAPRGSIFGTERVVRGSQDRDGRVLAVTRERATPDAQRPNLGFRCVRDVSPR